MRDLLEYVFSLLKDWKSDLAGGTVALFAWLWHPIFGKSMPDGILLPAIAVCFFAASFRAWKRNLPPKLTPIQIERRKQIKAKYDSYEPDGKEAMRSIVINGSIPAPFRNSREPRYFSQLPWDGLVIEDGGRWILPPLIAADITFVIEEIIKADQIAVGSSSNSHT